MLLTIQNLTKSFVGMKALDDVDFELAAGEVGLTAVAVLEFHAHLLRHKHSACYAIASAIVGGDCVVRIERIAGVTGPQVEPAVFSLRI